MPSDNDRRVRTRRPPPAYAPVGRRTRHPPHGPTRGQRHSATSSSTFISILWEAMPFIVLGAIIAGHPGRVPAAAGDRRSSCRRTRCWRSAIGGLLGLVFPMCECGIVVGHAAAAAQGAAARVVRRVHARRADHQRRRDLQHLRSRSRPHGIGVGDGRAAGRARLPRRRASPALVVQRAVPQVRQQPADAARSPATGEPQLPLDVPDVAQVHPSEERAGEKRPPFQRVGNISETALHDFVDITVFLILGACWPAPVKVWRSTPDEVSDAVRRLPGLGDPRHDGAGDPDVPVQRGRRLRGGQLHRRCTRRRSWRSWSSGRCSTSSCC